MNSDIRISVSFPTHPKTIMLIERLGLEASWALLRLWVFAAQHRPDGVLRGMNLEALRIACGYAGRMEEFVSLLKESATRFLDDDDPETGALILRDWKEHNPWVAGAKARSERARELAQMRWDAERKASRKAGRSSARNKTRHAPIPSPTSPLPPPHTNKHEIPSWIDAPAWDGFLKMRASIKKPLKTTRAILKIIDRLAELRAQGHDPTQVLDQSTMNSWQGVFPLQEGHNGKQAAHYEPAGKRRDRELLERHERVVRGEL